MLALQTPSEAYRRIAFDARVEGASPDELVSLCYEQFDMALGDALLAASQGDNHRKSSALTRALSAVTALQLGIDALAITGVRADFCEIREAMASNESPTG
jgi:flagellin-specific chaperone FliS